MEVFVSYSHKDDEMREQLGTHLSMLKRKAVVSEWNDRRILPGQKWDKQIDRHLESADIILLLVSPDFLASDYSYDIEVARAMQRHEAGEAHVIPVILRHCDDWQSAPFGNLQALPKDARPVKDWPDRDKAFADVAAGIRRVVSELLSSSEAQPETMLPRGEGEGAAREALPPSLIRRRPSYRFGARQTIYLVCALAMVALIIFYWLLSRPLTSPDTSSITHLQATPNANPPATQQPMPTPMLNTALDFESAKKKLGKPRQGEKLEMAYQARHEHAMLVWVDGSQDFFLLKENQKLVKIRGENVDDNSWYFDEENRKRTKTPEGKDPPYGTFAMSWMSNSEWWEHEVGWRAWHCLYPKGIVHIQWFEHGLIIGDLRRVKEDYRVAVYVLLTDESMWAVDMPERRPPLCEKPATNKDELADWLKQHPAS